MELETVVLLLGKAKEVDIVYSAWQYAAVRNYSIRTINSVTKVNEYKEPD